MLSNDESPPTPPWYSTSQEDKMEFEFDWEQTLDMFPRPPGDLPSEFDATSFSGLEDSHSTPNISTPPNLKMDTAQVEAELQDYCPYGTPNSGDFHFSPISPPNSVSHEKLIPVVHSPEETSPAVPPKTKDKGKARVSIDLVECEIVTPPSIDPEPEEDSFALTREEKQHQADADAAIALKFAMAELMELGLSEEDAFQQVCRNESNQLSREAPSTPPTKTSAGTEGNKGDPGREFLHTLSYSPSNSSLIRQDPLLASFEEAYETHVISKHVPNVSSPFLSTGWLPPAHGPEYSPKPSTSYDGSPLSSPAIRARKMIIADTSLTRESSVESDGSLRQSSLVGCMTQQPSMLLEETASEYELIQTIQHKLDEIYEDNRRALIRDIDQITIANIDRYSRARSKSWNVGRYDNHSDRYGQYNHYHSTILSRVPRYTVPAISVNQISASRSFTANTTNYSTRPMNQVAEPQIQMERVEVAEAQKTVLGSAWNSLLESVGHRVGWSSGNSRNSSIPETYPEEMEHPSHHLM